MSNGDIEKAYQEILTVVEPFVKTRKKNDELLFDAREHLSRYEPFFSTLSTDAKAHYNRFIELLQADDASTAPYNALVRTSQADRKLACAELWGLFVSVSKATG